ncbi:hypothetical protein ABZZ74_37245 [Streptomyces sp. NPDC006476]|uniref:hypothetical protein n=1 Tax=Streptomyces sp. NPDC006476 TaxID=3157175 RepID=UPI0033B0C4AE
MPPRAEKKLHGDPAAWFRTDTTLSNRRPLYVDKLLRYRQFTAAVRAWSRCMGRAAHPYPDPDAARQGTRDHAAGRSRAGEARSFAAETRIAVADATCARTVPLRSFGERREAHPRPGGPRHRDPGDHPRGPGCNANWRSHGRDGYVRAWEGTGCSGTLLGATPGNDSDWSASPARRDTRPPPTAASSRASCTWRAPSRSPLVLTTFTRTPPDPSLTFVALGTLAPRAIRHVPAIRTQDERHSPCPK